MQLGGQQDIAFVAGCGRLRCGRLLCGRLGCGGLTHR
jgi:hypothetical protein